jgi:hypothetical protein
MWDYMVLQGVVCGCIKELGCNALLLHSKCCMYCFGRPGTSLLNDLTSEFRLFKQQQIAKESMKIGTRRAYRRPAYHFHFCMS